MIHRLTETLATVQLPTEVLPRKLLPKNDLIIDDNDKLIDQLSDRYEKSRVLRGNVRPSDLVVLYLGQIHSPLRSALIEYLLPEDITLILFSTEEQLWYWLNTNSSLIVASLVIQTNTNIRNILFRSHAYENVRSILVHCRTNELTTLQSLSRSLTKIDGIHYDNPRLLIKLVLDLALFSEEMGDQQNEDENNELEAQRNYDRALKLCSLARRL